MCDAHPVNVPRSGVFPQAAPLSGVDAALRNRHRRALLMSPVRSFHGRGVTDVTDELDEEVAADLAVRAAYAAVAVLAADELDVFDAVAADWRHRVAAGPGVDAGIDDAPLTEVALRAVAAALGEVVVVVAAAGRIRRHRRPSTVEQTEPPPLSAEQTGRLRAACVRHAVALGLPTATAEVLAGAAIGTLDGSRVAGDGASVPA
jgi:hypothetical protein